MANITDFFDPHNKDHIEAYKHLCKTGCWPESFYKPEMTFNASWHFELSMKLAGEYIKAFDSGKIT
jgi:hypothetical protein